MNWNGWPRLLPRTSAIAARQALAQLKGRGVGSTVSYYVNDHIGIPQELLDEDGNVVWSAIYRAYGHTEMQAGICQPLRLQGQYADEESGLHYNRYRYYNPLAGKYISQDPISIRFEYL